jgi:hypothetical protein
MEEIFSSATLVDFKRTSRSDIPEDRTLHNHFCENLESYILPGEFRVIPQSVQAYSGITYEVTCHNRFCPHPFLFIFSIVETIDAIGL